MYKKRLLTKRLHQLLENFPVVVISGARQVGKSTLIRHEYEGKMNMVIFDQLLDIGNARKEPELFLRNHPSPLILDEIQYSPQVVSVLKRLVDENRRPGQYLLTGSQQWSVMKNLSESLAGRAVFLDLEGFSLAEIAESIPEKSWLELWLENPRFLIEQPPLRLPKQRPLFDQIWRGSFPEAQELDKHLVQDFYLSYLRTYVERDIRLMADIQDLELFSRFVRLASALTAQEINYSELGRELGLSPQTSRRWLSILESTFQWTSIPPYSGNILKRVSKKPKSFLRDTGLACFGQSISSPEALSGHPLWGSIFETAVVAEIRKLSSALSNPPYFYHWRLDSGSEVDLILERDGKHYPIEIKAKSQPGRQDTRGLSAFRTNYPHLNVQPGLVISPAEKWLQISDLDYAMPWDVM